MGDGIISRFRQNEGFTLVELLIALTLLVVAMIPLAVILQTGLRASVNSKQHMHARELAATEIDKAKSLNFDAIGLYGATGTYATASDNVQIQADLGTGLNPTSTITTPSGSTYTVTRDVRKVIKSQPNPAATKKVIITVTWDSPSPGGSEELSTDIGATDMST